MQPQPSPAPFDDTRLHNLPSALRSFISSLLRTLSDLGARNCTFTLLPRTVQIRFFDPNTDSHCILNYSRHSTRLLFGTEFCSRRLLTDNNHGGNENWTETRP